MSKFVLVASMMFLLVGCAEWLATTSLEPESTIAGDSVVDTAIQLKKPFKIRPGIGLWSMTFPAGLYVAKFEDRDGVYFESPVPLMERSYDWHGQYETEGIYISKQSWSRYQAYINFMPATDKYDIPVPIDFTVVKQP